MRLSHIAIIPVLLSLLGGYAAMGADQIPYSVPDVPWDEAYGKHRAIVSVEAAAPAVWLHLQWRRRDHDADSRQIIIVDAATGKTVDNLVRVNVNRDFADLVFQPATAPGEYYVYYLPYQVQYQGGWYGGDYLPVEVKADPQWVAANGLNDLAAGNWRSLSQARVLQIQARSEFSRFDPMEVVATSDEVAALLERRPQAQYLVFPEDRRFPIRMLDEIPLRWATAGPANALSVEAQPGEYYAFQLGVWAAREALGNVSLEMTDLQGEGGRAITRGQMTCVNLTGSDWLGRPISKRIDVASGRVQPLWIGIQIPSDAAGTYTGAFAVRPEGQPASTVTLSLKVSGEVIEDGGVSDLWRMSRLKWLDSTLGLDEDIVPPYTPLRVNGSTVSCLLRDVRFGPQGLPESIRSNGREVLAAPMAFTVTTNRGEMTFPSTETQVSKAAPGVVERVSVSEGQDAKLTVRCKMEADGCLTYRLKLEPRRLLRVSDIGLRIPQRRDCATYLMGMGKQGGYRPSEWKWKWDHKRANNMVWIVDVDAGLQLQLRPEQDV